MGYQLRAGYQADICLMFEKPERYLRTMLPRHHHLSLNSITEFNFNGVDKFPDMTDHFKIVLQSLKDAVEELSQQVGESGLTSYVLSPATVQPTGHATDDIFESLETSRQQWCISSDCHHSGTDVFLSMLPSAPAIALLVAPNERVSHVLSEDVESENCDYSVWPWSNNLRDFSIHDFEMEKNYGHMSISYQFLPAENVSIDNGQLYHTRPKDIIHLDNSRYFNHTSLPDMQSVDFGFALLCQFVDHNGLQDSELCTRQVVFQRTSPSSSETQGTPSGEKNLPSAHQLRLVQDYMPENVSVISVMCIYFF